MEIRFAEAKDVTGILALLKQVGGVHHRGRPDIFRSGAQKYGASQVLSMLSSSKTPIFVATEGGRVVGYCFCQLRIFEHDPVMTDRRTLYIDDLCVEENVRGNGIGRSLFNEARRYAQMRKCDSITLNVWCCNDGAMRFYEALGLKPQKIGMEMGL